jgi:hypothetical protein
MLMQITKGQFAIVDDVDFQLVSGIGWSAQRSKHSNTYYARGRYKGKLVLMHRLILGFPPSKIDHRNGNGLDNRRENLRRATHSQNVRNGMKRSCNTSGYIGVHFHKANRKWVAYVGLRYHVNYLGSFNTAEEAARARDEAAKKLHGEFAKLNFHH